MRQIKVIQERAWRRQKMRRRGTGIWYVLAIAAAAAGCILYIENLKNRSAEEYPVLEWIEAQKNQDIEAVEAKLLARDEAERAEQEEQAAGSEETLSPRQRFGQAVLVGDSVAEGFIDYQILDPSRIVAHKGMRSDTMGEYIDKALELSPTQLFLSVGLNDMEYCWGDSARFAAEYEKRLQEIREREPDLPIYVNAIMPILPAAVEKKAVLGKVGEFNAALKELCERWEISFLDNGDLLEGHEDWYQKDSIHLKSTPYLPWLERMEEAAGL